MSDEPVKPIPLRHHLLFIGLIVGLVALIAVFFTSYPLQCGTGYTVAATGHTQFCVRSGGP